MRASRARRPGQRGGRPTGVVLAILSCAALAACAAGAETATPGAPSDLGVDPSPAVTASAVPGGPGPSPSAPVPGADPSLGPTVELCDRIGAVEGRLADLSALELRPTARVTLDIELSRLQAAFADMRQDALEARDLDLAAPLRRLGHRLDDLALAVEDFRTTSRPRDAAEHVAQESTTFADALAGFRLLARC